MVNGKQWREEAPSESPPVGETLTCAVVGIFFAVVGVVTIGVRKIIREV